MRRWLCGRIGLIIALMMLINGLGNIRTQAQPPTADATLQGAFAKASEEFGIPDGLLLGVSYNLTRWEHHQGEPSTSGGFGLLHLTEVERTGHLDGRQEPSVVAPERLNTLALASTLTGIDPERLKASPIDNIRGGAAVLAEYAQRLAGTSDPQAADWYGAVALYSGWTNQTQAVGFADSVYATLATGVERTTSIGEHVRLAPQTTPPDRSRVAQLGLVDLRDFTAECPQELACDVVPAAYVLNNANDPSDYGNYDLANRPEDGLPIRYIIIHDTEGSYTSTLQYFQNPTAYVAAQYVLRSSDGHIAQMVENKNVGWHAGNWFINSQSIGFEHEGVAIEGATWYTEALYQSSARLARYLCNRYAFPCDRAHIIGHDEIPGPQPSNQAGMHWDPGPFWDWAHYMELVNPSAPPPPTPKLPIVEIAPDFATNQPPLTYCYEVNDCRDVPTQSANFVYVYSAPSFDAPLLTNPYITAEPTRANNWANKALTGQRFYHLATQGDWDAIYFSGQVGWIYNPDSAATTQPSEGMVITPKPGVESIPVYGRAYPEASAYPMNVPPQTIVKIYDMPAGQRYIASEVMNGRYYWSPVYTPTLDPTSHIVVSGTLEYYQIWYNHRLGYVQVEDVQRVSEDLAVTPLNQSVFQIPGRTVRHTMTITNQGTTTARFDYSQTTSAWGGTIDAPTDDELAPGESAAITYDVIIPETANDGEKDDVWITYWFEHQTDQLVSTRLTTTARDPDALLPIIRK